ncbi:MAG: hypothetical protein ACE5Z5_12520 [Candidatus Bathyarchaeia archaeon]
MPIKDTRSLIEVGGERRSLAMTLPYGWVKFWDLEKGLKTPVLYDSVLVIIPPNHPRRKEIEEQVREILIGLK